MGMSWLSKTLPVRAKKGVWGSDCTSHRGVSAWSWPPPREHADKLEVETTLVTSVLFKYLFIITRKSAVISKICRICQFSTL